MVIFAAAVGSAALVGFLLGVIVCKWRELLTCMSAALDRSHAQAVAAAKDDGPQEEEEEEEEHPHDILESFLSIENAPGLDDHPELMFNPLILQGMKKAKEAQRMEQMLELLIQAQNFEEGYLEALPPDKRKQLEDELLSQAQQNRSAHGAVVGPSIGSVPGFTKMFGRNTNSAKILEGAGASFAPGGNGSRHDDLDEEERKAFEARERWKQIDQHLNFAMKVDVTRIGKREADRMRKAKNSDGRRPKDALTVAKETKHKHWQDVHTEVLPIDSVRDFTQRGRARVAPPLDHQVAGASNVSTQMARKMEMQNTIAGRRSQGDRGSRSYSVSQDEALIDESDVILTEAEMAKQGGGSSPSKQKFEGTMGVL